MISNQNSYGCTLSDSYVGNYVCMQQHMYKVKLLYNMFQFILSKSNSNKLCRRKKCTQNMYKIEKNCKAVLNIKPFLTERKLTQ
jgi:hypothetical protein